MSEILDWVDTGDFLAAIGARNLTKSAGEYSFSCFSEHHAHGDSTPSAGMNAETTLWRCRNPACGLRGNAADFLAALKGYTYTEALRVLQERYGGPEISTEPGALENEVERIRRSYEMHDETRILLTDDEYADRFGLHWPLGAGIGDGLPDPMEYMIARGFDAETLNDWGIGYDDMSDRLTIPVHDIDGQLVGIKGRAWDPEVQPRYISIGDKLNGDYVRYGFHTYMKSMHVFGLNRVAPGSHVNLVEGELNAMAMRQMGWPNTAAVAGAEFSQRQCELIVARASSVCIFFDGDAAGAAGTTKVAEMLHPYLPVSIIEDAGFDAADALDASKPFTPQILRLLLGTATPYLLSYLTTS